MFYIVLFVFIFFAIVIFISDNSDPSANDAIYFAEKNVKSVMKDPDSVKFDSVKFYPESSDQKEEISGYVCGYVNGKNSFGAFAGRGRFITHVIVTNNGKSARISPPLIEQSRTESALDVMWNSSCK